MRDMLSGVRDLGYEHTNGRAQPAQEHLQTVRRELRDLLPAGMSVRVSGAGQSLPIIPWLAVLDADVTSTAQEGLYVVYLYRRDLSVLYLSMNQGATQHLRNAREHTQSPAAAEAAAVEQLVHESELIQEQLSERALTGTVSNIILGDRRFLPRGYEAGNIAAIEYDLMSLPSQERLREDLSRFLSLYSTCVEIKNELRITRPDNIHTVAIATRAAPDPAARPPRFRPKDAGEYIAEVPNQTQRKGRRHEALLTSFADKVGAGRLTITNDVHPIDAVVLGDPGPWLIEAKIVGANAEDAVRAAIGQLFAYRHFFYRHRDRPDPHLVALFSEPVGDAFPELLTSLGIEAIWQSGTQWAGEAPDMSASLLAALEQLAAPPPTM